MFNDLDETIRRLLLAELPEDHKVGDIGIAFDQPKMDWVAQNQTAEHMVNLFLYDVKENAQLKRQQWETVANGANGVPSDPRFVHQKKAPLRLDCFYMLTTWSTSPQIEHWLLGNCLLALGRHPVLPENHLAGSLRNQPFPIRTRLAAHDVLTNPAEVWSALGNDMRPSVSYIATISLDPRTVVSTPAVTTVVATIGQIVSSAPMAEKENAEDAIIVNQQ